MDTVPSSVLESLILYGPMIPSSSTARNRAEIANARLTNEQRDALLALRASMESTIRKDFERCSQTSVEYNGIDVPPESARMMSSELWNLFMAYFEHYSLALYEIFQTGSTDFPNGLFQAEDGPYGYEPVYT